MQARLSDPETIWQPLMVCWYGGAQRSIEVATGTALWYHGEMPIVPLRWTLIHDPEGTFDPQALLCTDQNVAPQQIIEWFVLRWQLEVTFHEACTHLGVETGRQWSDLAIARTMPALLGLFSLVTLTAQRLLGAGASHPVSGVVRQSCPHVRRYPGVGPPTTLAPRLFRDVAIGSRHDQNPPRGV